MQRVCIFILCVLIVWFRWGSMVSPLPGSWTPELNVRFTAPILDQIVHSDTKTIIKKGIWRIEIMGYAEIIPGDLVRCVGRVEPKLLDHKPFQIVMKNPTFEVVESAMTRKFSIAETVQLGLVRLRGLIVDFLEKSLPEPMSSLAAGILLGVSKQMPADFYQALVNTGTLHIVAASGYNVSIIASVMMELLSFLVNRGSAIGIGIGGILLYVLMAGGSASVVRAGVMGSLTLIAYYFGRPAEARRLLWVTIFVMLIVNPLNLLDVGFQLTTYATIGILYIEPWIRSLFRVRWQWLHEFLKDYLYPTLAATIATLPVIISQFGRVSLISPLVNMLVLPMIPLIMGLTAMVSLAGMVSTGLGQVMAWFLYPPLWYVIEVIKLFGGTW